MAGLALFKKSHFAFRYAHDLCGWLPNHFHDTRHLVMLAVSGKDRISDVKLCHNASKRPHVNTAIVGNPQHNLRSSVEPGLNVCVNSLVLESGASKVNYFNT